jgi:toxin FitB
MMLIDTNVLSETRRKQPNGNVKRWLQQQSVADLYLSSLVIAEIEAGIANTRDEATAEAVRVWLEGTVLPGFAGRILPFTVAEASVFGRWSGAGTRDGQPVAIVDAQIAATAFVHGLSVVTRNSADFLRFPVRVINPWEAS